MAFFKLYNPRASAQFFYTIHQRAPTKIWIYVSSSILLIIFQSSLIFNTDISEVYTTHLLNQNPKYN